MGWLRVIGSCCVVLAVAAGCGGGRSTRDTGPALEGKAFPLRPCEQIASGARCGFLRVPLDPSRKTGRTLLLRVGVIGPRHAANTLIALTGGPGQPGVEYLARQVELMGPQASRYRVVMIDQRGTGPRGIECPHLQREVGTSDLTPASPGAVDDCAALIGEDRDLYTTSQTVADLERLRVALDVKRWSMLGVSYGTYVAQRYAMAHPAHVAALVLLSVVPRTGIDGLLRDNLRSSGSVLRKWCTQHSCETDPARDLAAALLKGADGAALLDTLTAISIFDPDFRDVVGALHEAASGQGARLKQLERDVHAQQAAPFEAFSAGLHAATLCAESHFPWDAGSDPASRQGLIKQASRRLTAVSTAPFDTETAVTNGLLATCRYWPSISTTAPAVGRLPRVPTLMVAGALDLSTPKVWAGREADAAPWARLLVLAGVGHRVARARPATHAVRKFLSETGR